MARPPMHAVPLFWYKENRQDGRASPPAPFAGMSETSWEAAAATAGEFTLRHSGGGGPGFQNKQAATGSPRRDIRFLSSPKNPRPSMGVKAEHIYLPNWVKICFYDHQVGVLPCVSWSVSHPYPSHAPGDNVPPPLSRPFPHSGSV